MDTRAIGWGMSIASDKGNNSTVLVGDFGCGAAHVHTEIVFTLFSHFDMNYQVNTEKMQSLNECDYLTSYVTYYFRSKWLLWKTSIVQHISVPHWMKNALAVCL